MCSLTLREMNNVTVQRTQDAADGKPCLETALGRGRDEVGRLLERCSKVEAALNTHDMDAQCHHASPEPSAAPANRISGHMILHPKNALCVAPPRCVPPTYCVANRHFVKHNTNLFSNTHILWGPYFMCGIILRFPALQVSHGPVKVSLVPFWCT